MTHLDSTADFLIGSDRSKLDINTIHGFLSQSYWSKNIPIAVVQKSIENSLCIGVYQNDKQVGFARVITDYATFAYLADVFILEQYRGCGLGKKLIQFILEYPELQNLRRWMLATRDAHELYQQYGFQALANPEIMMEIPNPDVYSHGI